MKNNIYPCKPQFDYINLLSENFQFLEVKFSIYLNRRVFVMNYTIVKYGVRYFYGCTEDKRILKRMTLKCHEHSQN